VELWDKFSFSLQFQCTIATLLQLLLPLESAYL
jgi:hypothetical protein